MLNYSYREANSALCNSSYTTEEPRLRMLDQIINEIVMQFLDSLGLLHHNTMDRKGLSADTILSSAHADGQLFC